MKNIINEIQHDVENHKHYFSEVIKDLTMLLHLATQHQNVFLRAYANVARAENEEEIRSALKAMSDAITAVYDHVENLQYMKAVPQTLNFEEKYYPSHPQR